MNRITVTLEPNERKALWLLAKQERRDPRAQAALLIREGLEARGILQPLALCRDNEDAEQPDHEPEG